MLALTPAERRGALVVMALLVLGAGHDLWRTAHPRETGVVGSSLERESASVGTMDSLAVPGTGEAVAIPSRPAGARPADASRLRVNLNRATAEDLDRLPGVGPVLARRILEHRRLHGPFRSPDELLAVRGIGPRLYERLRLRVSVDPE